MVWIEDRGDGDAIALAEGSSQVLLAPEGLSSQQGSHAGAALDGVGSGLGQGE